MKRKRATHRNQAYDHGVFFVNDSNEYYITYRELVKQLEENIRLRAENRNLMHHLEAQIVGDLAARKTLCEQSDKYKDERDEARRQRDDWREAARRLKALIEENCSCSTCSKA